MIKYLKVLCLLSFKKVRLKSSLIPTIYRRFLEKAWQKLSNIRHCSAVHLHWSKSAIVVNELSGRDDTQGGYVLLGLTETEDSYVVVRSIVNKKNMETRRL